MFTGCLLYSRTSHWWCSAKYTASHTNCQLVWSMIIKCSDFHDTEQPAGAQIIVDDWYFSFWCLIARWHAVLSKGCASSANCCKIAVLAWNVLAASCGEIEPRNPKESDWQLETLQPSMFEKTGFSPCWNLLLIRTVLTNNKNKLGGSIFWGGCYYFLVEWLGLHYFSFS